ncbi:MAG: hypothetical protein SVY15_07870 [Halobacteriota archaeon]|nr:hypothetical protein [Halobacteriota archaeon]
MTKRSDDIIQILARIDEETLKNVSEPRRQFILLLKEKMGVE